MMIVAIRSRQRVLQELAEAFNGWYGKRRNGDTRPNPPGYRKHGDEHPRSTVTFKAAGFKRRHPVQPRSTLKRIESEGILVGFRPDNLKTRPEYALYRGECPTGPGSDGRAANGNSIFTRL